MCGIAGVLLNQEPNNKGFPKELDLSLIAHRGPDRTSDFSHDGVWLGHTRLSILDLSDAGNQPMKSDCGNYTLVFNGEIYNHLELRKKYLPNYKFKGHSDTETILHLFLLKKELMLEDLVGMWAMLIWDEGKKELFVSRDRFGQKPLYYQINGNGIYFGSEIKLFKSINTHFTFNPTAIAEYLSSGNYGHLGEETFYKEIHQFPMASFAYVKKKAQDINSTKFWDLSKFPKANRSFGKKEKEELKATVVEAVLSQMIADVKIGITLSGGIDSSIIAGILAKHSKTPIHIFTAQIPGDPKDESKYVKEVLRMFDQDQITLHYVDLTKVSYDGLLEKGLRIQEEPFGDPSISAHSILMQAAKNAGVKVIMGGQGADEIFAGYDHAIGGILLAQLKNGKFDSFLKNYKYLTWGKREWSKFGLALVSPKYESKIRQQKRIARENFIDTKWIYGKREIKTASLVDFNELLFESLFKIHLPHLLHYDDRNAMNESVEGRTPFLDHRILEFLIQIRPEEFMKSGKRKSLLREACEDYLPPIVENRRDKIGFHTPLKEILLHDQEKIKRIFHTNLPESMKSTLSMDLKKLNTVNPPLESLLRIYRTYSVLLTQAQMNVKFPLN
jgi:asparagine synthase (glutamine-hydrolysing)